MKTLELTGAALDWAVAKCEGIGLGPRGFVVYYHKGEPAMWQPSTDWAQGGPIIERERIEVTYQSDVKWQAGQYPTIDDLYCGLTPLIAAMRCYVASKMGNTVEIPEDLM